MDDLEKTNSVSLSAEYTLLFSKHKKNRIKAKTFNLLVLFSSLVTILLGIAD